MAKTEPRDDTAMLLIIEYDDGADEALSAELEGGVISQGGNWLPGILVQAPERCYFKSDYFEAALNEGHERAGYVRPEPSDPDFVGFRWKLMGNEEDACREKMARWIKRIGVAFDPMTLGQAYLHGGLLRVLRQDRSASGTNPAIRFRPRTRVDRSSNQFRSAGRPSHDGTV